MAHRVDRIEPEIIEVGERLRPLNDDAVVRLMESIQKIGLQTPISVRWRDDEDGGQTPVLIAGRHRREAAIRLDIPFVDCVVFNDEKEARLWEIAENLHRADLTPLERSEHIAEWVRLTGEKVAHVAPPTGGVQPKEQGIRKATRELGIDRTEAQRAVKIDGLSPEAKQAALECGLDKNQSALLRAARAAPDKQEDAIRNYKPVPKPPAPTNDIETKDKWMTAMMNVWNRGAREWREEFKEITR